MYSFILLAENHFFVFKQKLQGHMKPPSAAPYTLGLLHIASGP